MSPVIWKSVLAAASCTLLASCLLGTQSKRGSVVDNELRVGTIFASNGDPAVNARVRVYPVGHLPDTLQDTAKSSGNKDVYSTRTDGKGQYSIGELPNGEYNILADQAGQYAIQDSVYLDEKTAALANDTLNDPGSLTGVVRMQPNHDPRFALVQVLGTYNYANVDANGRFTLATLAEGKYTLRVFTSLTDYNTLFKSITIVAGKRDTLRDTLVLPYLGIPVVTGLKASFDTLRSVVSLSWDSAVYRDFSQYQVYRDAQPVLDATKIPVGTTTGTAFQDNLYGILGGGGSTSISLPAAYEYRVRIKSKSDQVGLSYGNVAVQTPPPSLVQTVITLQVKSIKWDSILQADSIEVSATLRNPTRKLQKLIWTFGAESDSLGGSLAVDSLGGTLSAERTLKFAWKAEGALVVGVRVTDNAGTVWTESLNLPGNTAPSLTGTPATKGRAYEVYRFAPVVVDPDHDTLRFSIANAPAWATFDSLTGVLSGTPTNVDTGTYSGFVITVTDGRRGKQTAAFQVKVLANPWIPGPKSPVKLSYGQVAVELDRIIFHLSDSLRVLNVDSGTWQTVGRIPSQFNINYATVLNGKILAFSYRDRVTRFYDPVQRNWESKTALPDSLPNVTSGAVVNGIFYSIGGGNVWAYDPIQDIWRKMKPMPSEIGDENDTQAECVTFDQKIILMGMQNGGGSQNLLKSAGFVYIYDPATDSWAAAAPIEPRIASGVGVIENRVYKAGGINRGDFSHTNRVQEYNPISGEWKEKSPMPNAISNMAFAVFDKKMIFIGGMDGFTNLNDTWIYDPKLDP